MITKEKLIVYRRFEEDPDGLARVGSLNERAALSQGEYALIERLLRGLKLCSRGLATAEFCEAIEAEVRSSCDDTGTIMMLAAMI
jgi:hypothetical protein